MQFTVSFVIRAKAALYEWSVGTSLEGSVFITEPVLWACDTSDRVAWTREEIIEGTKVVFVNHARTTFLTGDHWRSVAESLADVDVFDKYWNIEVFWGVDEFVGDAISPALLKELASKGNRFLVGLASVSDSHGSIDRPDDKG